MLDPAARMAYRNGLIMMTPMAGVRARGRGTIGATQTSEGGVVVMAREIEVPSTDDATR